MTWIHFYQQQEANDFFFIDYRMFCYEISSGCWRWGVSRSNVHTFPCHQPNLISPSDNFLISNKIIRIEFNTPNVIYIFIVLYGLNIRTRSTIKKHGTNERTEQRIVENVRETQTNNERKWLVIAGAGRPADNPTTTMKKKINIKIRCCLLYYLKMIPAVYTLLLG